MCFRLVLHLLQLDWLPDNKIALLTQEYLALAVKQYMIVVMMELKCGSVRQQSACVMLFCLFTIPPRGQLTK